VRLNRTSSLKWRLNSYRWIYSKLSYTIIVPGIPLLLDIFLGDPDAEPEISSLK
jgi:hypothetical protein